MGTHSPRYKPWPENISVGIVKSLKRQKETERERQRQRQRQRERERERETFADLLTIRLIDIKQTKRKTYKKTETRHTNTIEQTHKQTQAHKKRGKR